MCMCCARHGHTNICHPRAAPLIPALCCADPAAGTTSLRLSGHSSDSAPKPNPFDN